MITSISLQNRKREIVILSPSKFGSTIACGTLTTEQGFNDVLTLSYCIIRANKSFNCLSFAAAASSAYVQQRTNTSYFTQRRRTTCLNADQDNRFFP